MSPEQFAYWLQGFLELGDVKEIDPRETQIIKDHLKLVFSKETPVYDNPYQPVGTGIYLNPAPVAVPQYGTGTGVPQNPGYPGGGFTISC